MTTNPALRTVLVIAFLLCFAKHARPQARTQQQTRTQQQSQTQETPAPPNCAAGIAFTNPETSPLQETKDLTPQGDGKRPDVILLQILTTTGNPLDECLPGMINLNVTFFDVDDNPICSGSVPDQTGRQTQLPPAEHGSYLGKPVSFFPVRSNFLEIRPFNVLEFVRWMNPPSPSPNATRATRLFCISLDGLSEVSPSEMARATTLRIYATFVTKSIGSATAGWRFILVPSAPPTR